MKGCELSAFIASHFGKILPVLPVNSNMSTSLTNVAQCHTQYDWLPFPLNSTFKFPLHYIIHSTDEKEMQLYLTYNYIFLSQKTPYFILHHALCTMDFFFWRRGWIERGKLLFSLWSVTAVGWGLCLKAASPGSDQPAGVTRFWKQTVWYSFFFCHCVRLQSCGSSFWNGWNYINHLYPDSAKRSIMLRVCVCICVCASVLCVLPPMSPFLQM